MHADKKALGITYSILVVNFFVENMVLSKKIISEYLFYPGSRTNSLPIAMSGQEEKYCEL